MDMTIIIIIFIILIIILLSYENVKSNESYYTRLNMSNKSQNCGCPCVTYGSLFDYKKQKSQRKYGVPLGCQKIF